jgi:hypothetical protein
VITAVLAPGTILSKMVTQERITRYGTSYLNPRYAMDEINEWFSMKLKKICPERRLEVKWLSIIHSGKLPL